MKNRIMALVLVIALVAVGIAGATMAYFTDTEVDVNVMTIGNVKIAQHEYERALNADGTYKTDTIDDQTSYVLQDFTQAKPLYPIVGDPSEPIGSAYAGYDTIPVRMSQVGSYGGMDVFAGKNAIDKFVVVQNTGRSDAYVRTLVAIEVGTTEDDGKLVKTGYHFTWKETYIGTFVVDGNEYKLYEYIYNGWNDGGRHVNGALSAGDTAYPSLCQVYLKHNATNEYCEALDGNGNGTLDILVLSQAVQTMGFSDAQTALDTAFGKVSEKAAEWFGGVSVSKVVNTAAELQEALNSALDGDTIILGADITGDVTATQKENVKITIDGNGKTFAGVLTVAGKSARYETTGLTIKNVNFNADAISADACIRLGDGTSATRYTCNVTVENCTFDVPGAVAIKSYTGGDWNLTVDGCTVNSGMHSMLQVTNVEKGLTVTNCKVYSKNGINLNNTPYLNMSGCEFETTGYCVRIGVNGATNNGNFTISNSTLTSANDDGDAVIILRGTMTGATVTLVNTTLTGTPDITGNANIVK